ncbi:MAG: type VI secretion system tip protein VgrG [Flavobacteriales bacterium]
MASKIPTDISDSTVNFTVKANGTAIKDYYPVTSIEISSVLNKIPRAEITLIDGTVESEDFPISESSDLKPGVEIEILCGYGSEPPASLFTGVIVSQSVQIDDSEPNRLVLVCKHKASVLTYNRKEAMFLKKKDSEMIASIIQTSSLKSRVESSTIIHDYMFQKSATDWDFILARAEMNGYVVSFDADTIVVGPPAFLSSTVLNIVYGQSILSFTGEINAEHQASGVNASGWDLKSQSLLTEKASEPKLNKHGNLNGQALSSALNQKELNLTYNNPLSKAELKLWADNQLLRMRMASIKCTISTLGNGLALPNVAIAISGLGDRFNGPAYVSEVEHRISPGSWTTQIKTGLSFNRISEKKDFSSPVAGGQLPPLQGLQTAVVKKISEDPLSEFRIQIQLNSKSTTPQPVWARLATFYATSSAGSGFVPEPGDEVIVGFLENDPRYPVILGSLYSSAHPAGTPPPDEKNNLKTIVTKNKLKLTFDEEKKSVRIETPGGNYCLLSDDDKSIEIADQNSNSIKLSSSGIEIKSNKDITLKANGNISQNATGKIDLVSQQDSTLSGLNVNCTAKIGFTAKGNATAEISASGQTTVKGAIVMIN